MTDSPTVLVISAYAPEKLAQLTARFDVHHVLPGLEFGSAVAPVISKAIDDRILRRVRGLATDPGRGARAELMDLMPRLEIISSVGVGVDAIDLAAAKRRGIAVTNTPDILTNDVADLAMGLLIAAARGIVAADRFVHEGRWRSSEAPLRRSIGGKTLGILGLGRICRAIAKRADAFGMTVLYSGTGKKPEMAYEHVPDLVRLAERSDFLALACKGGRRRPSWSAARCLQRSGRRARSSTSPAAPPSTSRP